MTGFIYNNNSYNVGYGSTEIEYANNGDNTLGYSMYGENIPEKSIPVQTQYYMHRTYRNRSYASALITTPSPININSNVVFEFEIKPNYSGGTAHQILSEFTDLSTKNPIKFVYQYSTNLGIANLYVTGQAVDENLDLSGWSMNVTLPGESFYNNWHVLKFDSSHIWLDNVDLNANVIGTLGNGSFSNLQVLGISSTSASYVGDFKSMKIIQSEDTLLDATIKPGDDYPDVNTSGYLHVTYPKFGWTEQDFIINGSPYTIMEF